MVIISWDFENISGAFAHELKNKKGIEADFINSLNTSKIVNNKLAKKIERFATKLDGWNGGPSYAPHPLIFQKV